MAAAGDAMMIEIDVTDGRRDEGRTEARRLHRP
jgi:hypothetical protein